MIRGGQVGGFRLAHVVGTHRLDEIGAFEAKETALMRFDEPVFERRKVEAREVRFLLKRLPDVADEHLVVTPASGLRVARHGLHSRGKDRQIHFDLPTPVFVFLAAAEESIAEAVGVCTACTYQKLWQVLRQLR